MGVRIVVEDERTTSLVAQPGAAMRIVLLAALVVVGACAKKGATGPADGPGDSALMRPYRIVFAEDSLVIPNGDGRNVVCPLATPNPATVKAGDSLQFWNDTAVPEAWYLDDGAFLASSVDENDPSFDSTATYVTFNTPGTFGYYALTCRVGGVPFSRSGLYPGDASPYSITVTP
jgi:hypothetical protein